MLLKFDSSTGTIRYQGREIFRFFITNDFWSLKFFKADVDINQCEGFVPDYLRDFILESIVTELSCKGCQYSSSMTILGKYFDVVCTCHTPRIENPGGKTLEYVKELVLINKKIVDKIVADLLLITENTTIYLDLPAPTFGKSIMKEYHEYFCETLGDDYEKYPFAKSVINDPDLFTGLTLKYIAECCQNGFEPKPNITVLSVQKKLKPDIEDVISHAFEHVIESEYWNNVLNFIAWLRENKMKPKFAGLHNAWNASNKGEMFYYIRLGVITGGYPGSNYPNKWVVTPYLINMRDYEDKIFAEGLQDFVWDHVNQCNICAEKCGEKSSKKRTILGKEFTRFGCNGFEYKLWVNRADEAAINSLKKLLLWEREARKNK
jgi:hypothetical protein